MASKGKYRHVGGGCAIRTASKYPCDDVYVGKKKVIEVISTKDAHFSMPDTISSPKQLEKKAGVKSVKVVKKKKLQLYEGLD